MSTRRIDPAREPFAADEAAWARAYSALPGGEPSPELDARVLATARAATWNASAPRRRRQAWLFGSGFGVAAAAVMAAGLAWQLGWIDGRSPVTPAPMNGSAETDGYTKPITAPQPARERIEIDYLREERQTRKPEPAAPAPASAPLPTGAPQVPPPPSALPAPSAPPAELTVPAPTTEHALADAPVPEPFPLDAETQSEIEPELGASAGMELRREQLAQPAAPQQTAGASASRGRLAKQAVELPPWKDDAQLTPKAWLERIRDRVQAGDRQGAEYSLRHFVLTHPKHKVPRDLQRLLVE